MRSRGSRFRASDRHAYRLELQLEFAAHLGAIDAGQVARRIIEALRMSPIHITDSRGLKECRVICHDLRAAIPLAISEGPQD